ncbi:MAG: hypothetical protein KAR01_03565 [Desulfocapsa sp.]|nr:hypothetical protein [Desulfocapsa sp.]
MTMFPLQASAAYRLQEKIKSLLGYKSFLRSLSKVDSAASVPLDETLISQLSGYPRNHNYEISDGKLIPSFKLYERLRLVLSAFPEPLESFLDIGCCRGFYVMSAAMKPSCKKAVGIDVHQPFVDLASNVSSHIGLDNTSFHIATLDKLVADPEKYQAPYQTILLIGTYHYLFWGSEVDPHSFGDHDTILKALSKLCTKRVILSGRLEIDRLPEYNRVGAENTERAAQYTTENFVKCAEKYFTVTCLGYLGTYPLLQLDKKDIHVS